MGIEQFPPLLRGSPKVTVATTAPVGPQTGDVWLDNSTNNAAQSGFRNLFSNGSLQVSQRGDGTFSFTGTSGYCIDGMVGFSLGSAVHAISRNQITVGQIAGERFYSYHAVSSSAAAGDAALFQIPVENTLALAGRTVTVSFMAGSSSGTPSVAIDVDQRFGTGGSSLVQTTIGKVQISTTFTRYSITFVMPSAVGKTMGTYGTDFTYINFWLSAGTTYAARASSIGHQNLSFAMGLYQIEVGGLTPFEFRPYSVDYAQCQRYFQRWQQPPLRGVFSTTVLANRMSMPLPVPMRIAPTPTMNGLLPIYDGSATTTVASISVNYSSTTTCELDLNLTAALTALRPAMIYQTGTSSLDLTAEMT